jgi:leukemia factor-related protein
VFSQSDLALATSPTAVYQFDPSNVKFNEDELKPQPIMAKSRKTFVPETMKDGRYWARRAKNNVAAKRSREARRLKENQIFLRANYLEKENSALKETVDRLMEENLRLKQQMDHHKSES